MLAYTAHSPHGPVRTTSPELLLAAFAVLDEGPRRATPRDLVEALTLPLVDPLLDLLDAPELASSDHLPPCASCVPARGERVTA